jgi:hypothetical protein
MAAPSFPEQIAELNSISEMIAANACALRCHGYGGDLDPAQIALGRQRSLLEHLIRCGINDGDALRAALAKREEPAI